MSVDQKTNRVIDTYLWKLIPFTCISDISVEDFTVGSRDKRQSGQVLWLESQRSMQLM